MTFLDPDGPPVSGIGAAYRSGTAAVDVDTASQPAQTWWQRRGGNVPAAPAGDVVRVASPSPDAPAQPPAPSEADKTMHPAYLIEPPDVLWLEPVRVVPRPTYRIEDADVLAIQVAEDAAGRPISGRFGVRPDGTVHLGPTCGTVNVGGQTLEQAAETVRLHLAHVLREPQVAVALADFRGVQQTRGPRRVDADGAIDLGSYGRVSVAGLTLPQAKEAVERQLAKYLLNPEVSVAVTAPNSKVFYVILDGGVFGQQVFRFPVTGNDTVLDAVSRVSGRGPLASTPRVWLARPLPAARGSYQILPVRWHAMVAAGDTSTNYQLFPGDRVYVKASFPVAFHNYLEQMMAPVGQFFTGTLPDTDAAAAAPANNRGS
jgi:polysaccharide export outer membrane protein